MTETTDLPTFSMTQGQIAGAFARYTRETGLELKLDMFALHAHPETIDRWIQTVSGLLGGPFLEALATRRDFFGLKVVEDDTVDPLHPQLRCTWAMTL